MKLYIGPEKKEYTVHEKILNSASSFFEGNPYDAAKPGDKFRTFTLPGDKTSTYDIFVPWLYGQDLSMQKELNLNDFVDLYVFAHEKDCAHLQNESIRHFMYDLSVVEPDEKLFVHIFEQTEKFGDVKLWELCALWCHWKLAQKEVDFNTETLKSLFAACPALLTKYLDVQPVPYDEETKKPKDPLGLNFQGGCYFHDHGLEMTYEKCYKGLHG